MKARSRVKKFRCPWCKAVVNGQVVDSRPIQNGQGRKRFCENCNTYFYTEERVVIAEGGQDDDRRTEDR